MKITTKKLIVFLGLLLLVFVAGSEVVGQVVDRGRYYCPIHDEIYLTAGEHGTQCSSNRTAPPAAEKSGGDIEYCSKCNTKYPKGTNHACPKPPPPVAVNPVHFPLPVGSEMKYRTDRRRSFVDIDVFVEQRLQRHSIYGNYGGYGYGERRTYYNLSGRNYLREWFGDKHHHRDHHEPQRHKHSDHHRGWGYGSYGYNW